MKYVSHKFFAGVDWGSEFHQVCVINQTGSIMGEQSFAHGGEGLCEMVQWILEVSRSASRQIDVAIEVPHGPVVETLMKHGFGAYSVNPRQLDRLRDRFSPSGAKDDRRDAYVLADSLRTDIRHFRPLKPSEPEVMLLCEFSRMRDELVGERGRLISRMDKKLWEYYPQFRQVIGKSFNLWILELWKLAPTAAAAKRKRPGTIEKLLKRHKVRRIDAKGVLEILGSKQMDVSEATVQGCLIRIKSIVKRLELLFCQIREADRQMDRLISSLSQKNREQKQQEQRGNQPSDIEILSSIPGVGRVVLCTLIGESYELLCRRDDMALRNLTGAAPVTRRSGKSKRVSQRRASHKKLSDAIYHWARTATQNDPVSRAKYEALRERGHGHNRALRSVADRLLYVTCRLLEKGVLFEKNFKKGGQLIEAKAG